MSYRSFKRVLGESNLERKILLLFASCLFFLITGSFWWYGLRTEKLVHERNQKAGRDFVDSSMLKYHWTIWHSSRSGEEGDRSGEEGLLHQTIRDLQTQSYKWEVLALKQPPINLTIEDKFYKRVIVPPTKSWEYQQLLELQAALGEQTSSSDESSPDTPADENGIEPQSPLAAQREIAPVFRERWFSTKEAESEHKKREYHYYQPVYWKQSCLPCHGSVAHVGALPAAHAGEFDLGPPFRVVKVIIPDRGTQRAINHNRAILLATAIVTVFVAMVAMYVIVRYVIVKPLQHLRYVSDEIGRGNIELRAEIHSNDEFQELAAAFNRMMRSLVDAQNKLRNLNRDLDGKVDELAQANMQLYEMNRLRGDFLANMSHELRTPLNSILGFSDVLTGIETLDDKQLRYVQNIQKSGQLLLDMINDILDLAKMESGKMDVKLSEFQIKLVVHAQCDLVRSLTEEKNIDLDAEVEPNLLPLYQDQSKVQQILTNLLSNAIKFTPEGGRITVSADQDNQQRLNLTVTDTGVGIAEEDRETIFEKFRQAASTSGDNLARAFSGTGLGLSIVKELSKLMGGDVSFVSELGKGSAFTVRLPWHRDQPSQHDAALVKTPKSLSAEAPRPGPVAPIAHTPGQAAVSNTPPSLPESQTEV